LGVSYLIYDIPRWGMRHRADPGKGLIRPGFFPGCCRNAEEFHDALPSSRPISVKLCRGTA